MEQFEGINLESQSAEFKPVTPFQMIFDKMVKDMRFVGMFTIIYGAITCLSIIGAIIGVPIIIIGLRIREAADQFAIFKATNEAAALRMGFELQGKFFRITKILIIIGIILTLIWIALIIIFLASGLNTLMQMREFEYNTI
ncbi:MAG: DUF5362 family protein [Melioribacter sp.]|uniref:DUF5362 family protein n=1 Tax=Rosettibacter primus TaxID=3111523 RepID=UPI00247D42D8|nr:DUF5362 family protein [Melioribacter sp.]